MTEPVAPILPTKLRAKDSILNKLTRTLTSALLFTVAFILAKVLLQAMIAGASKVLGYQVLLTYDRVYAWPRAYQYWSTMRVVAIYFLPPFLCLLTGLVTFSLLSAKPEWVKIYRLFLFWFALCLINITLSHLFFSSFGIGNAMSGYYQTYSILASWVGLKPVFMSVFSVFAIIVSILWGLLICNEILRYSHSSSLIRTQKGKNQFLLQVFLFPVLISITPIMFLSREFYFFPDLMMFVPFIFIWIGMVLRVVTDSSPIRGSKKDVIKHLPVIEFIMAAGLWFAVWQFLVEKHAF